MSQRIKFTTLPPLPADLREFGKSDQIAYNNQQVLKALLKRKRNKQRTGTLKGTLLIDDFKKLVLQKLPDHI